MTIVNRTIQQLRFSGFWSVLIPIFLLCHQFHVVFIYFFGHAACTNMNFIMQTARPTRWYRIRTHILSTKLVVQMNVSPFSPFFFFLMINDEGSERSTHASVSRRLLMQYIDGMFDFSVLFYFIDRMSPSSARDHFLTSYWHFRRPVRFDPTWRGGSLDFLLQTCM